MTGTTHVITGLRRKYAELLGLLKFRPDQDPDATLDAIRHIGESLLMFSPNEDMAAIKPVRPYKTDRRRWLRLALAVLRKADKPLTARAIARQIIADGHATAADLASIECGLYATLAGLEGIGIEVSGDAPKRWHRRP